MGNLSKACRVSLVLLFAALSGGSPAEAGTMIRQTTTVFDTGFHYNTHNRERVGLRIYYEDMQVSDTKWVWQIAYEAVAQHKNGFGQWVLTSELYNFTYNFKLRFLGAGGFWTTPVISGAVDLDHLDYSNGLVYDGASPQNPPQVVEGTFTAQRYGGKNGFSVTVDSP